MVKIDIWNRYLEFGDIFFQFQSHIGVCIDIKMTFKWYSDKKRIFLLNPLEFSFVWLCSTKWDMRLCTWTEVESLYAFWQLEPFPFLATITNMNGWNRVRYIKTHMLGTLQAPKAQNSMRVGQWATQGWHILIYS